MRRGGEGRHGPRYIPLVLKHAAALGSAALESRLGFFVGCASLTTDLMVPWLTRFIPRRWMYTAGTGSYFLGLSLVIDGGATATGFVLLFTVLGTATCFVCLNAHVLDYVPRLDLGRCQSQQMVYSATS